MPPPILITRPFLPPLEEFVPFLEQIWERRILTNKGPFHQELEDRLRSFLQVREVSLVTNGMAALGVAIEAAALSGEVITTPYSFVATTHAVKMERLQPVFVDVRPADLNIDPDAIEAAIGPQTCAIVAVHCYGNPCDVEAIERIAKRHDLTVIYDAAHAFGVRYRGRGLLSYGDFATLSFHATKAFNTFEGGAVIANEPEARELIERIRNFGIVDETRIDHVGTNAKMSEFNAALGLLQLRYFGEVRMRREGVDTLYRHLLAEVEGVTCLAIPSETEPNFSYFPILLGADYPIGRDELFERLRSQGIFARRYFYPLLSNLPMYRTLPSAEPERLPIATRASEQVLCLPIYPELSQADQRRIAAIVAEPHRFRNKGE